MDRVFDFIALQSPHELAMGISIAKLKLPGLVQDLKNKTNILNEKMKYVKRIL